MYGILLRQLFFVAAVVYSGSWDFLYGRCKQLFVIELNNAYFLIHLFENSVRDLHSSLRHLLLENSRLFASD